MMRWNFKFLIILTCFPNFIVIGQFRATKTNFNQFITTTKANLSPRDDDEPEDLTLFLRKNNLQLESRKFYEGDIKIIENDEDDLRQHDGGGTGLKDKDERWRKKNGFVTIPYVIDSSVYSDFQIKNIKYAMRIIEYETGCLRFKKRKRERDFIMFTMREYGCWSYVGRVGGRQIINLDNYCAEEHGVAIHEIIHSLGFYHMHSHTQRDDYIQILYQNIDYDDRHNFHKISRNEGSSFNTKYDYLSIMHYGPYYFSNNGRITILPHNRKYLDYIGQRSKMSPGDIKRLKNMYQCNDNKIEEKATKKKKKVKVEESEEFEHEEEVDKDEEEEENEESQSYDDEDEEGESTEQEQESQVNIHLKINKIQKTIADDCHCDQKNFPNNESDEISESEEDEESNQDEN